MEAPYLNGVLITESKVDPDTGEEFTLEQRQQHSRFGIITELAEILDIYKKHIYYGKDISEKHLVEEIGDLCWYIGLGFNTVGIIAANSDCHPVSGEETVCFLLEDALNVITRDDIQFEAKLMHVFGCMIKIINILDFDYPSILSKNLVKLRERYGSGFDADRAINRNTDAEQAAVDKEGTDA